MLPIVVLLASPAQTLAEAIFDDYFAFASYRPPSIYYGMQIILCEECGGRARLSGREQGPGIAIAPRVVAGP